MLNRNKIITKQPFSYTFNVISFDCEKTIENVKDSIMLHAESKNITIHWKKNDETIVYADENAFKEVIENLLSNAIKYSPSGSNIWITITTEKDFVTIRIKDEGPGFSDDDKLKLFKKFSRLSARPTAGESSIGLGLSIVKKLVSAMNGRITVESIHGEGAEFIVEFPKSDLSIHK